MLHVCKIKSNCTPVLLRQRLAWAQMLGVVYDRSAFQELGEQMKVLSNLTWTGQLFARFSC